MMIVQVVLLVILVFLVGFVLRQARLEMRNAAPLRTRHAGRVLAVVILGLAFGVLMNWDYARDRAGGKEAFLQAQVTRFENQIAKDHSAVFDAILGVMFVGTVIGTYELVAWGISAAARPFRKHGAIVPP